MSTLRDYQILFEQLERIYSSRLELFCSLARNCGAFEDEVLDVVHNAFLSLCALEPRGEIPGLIHAWHAGRGDRDRLEEVLSALLVNYVRFRALDRARVRHAHGGAISQAEPAVEPSDDAVLTRVDVGIVHAAAERLHEQNQLTAGEWAFWNWRLQNLDAHDQDFDRALPAWRIARIRNRLFAKLVIELERASAARMADLRDIRALNVIGVDNEEASI